MPILLEEHLKYPLPAMHAVRQKFENKKIVNLVDKIENEIRKKDIASKIKLGARVAVAVGSRGIANLREIVGEVVRQIQGLGGVPFIVSAMGSHGGGTPEGQLEILESYGITKENIGVDVLASLDVTHLGKTQAGIDVYFDTTALNADVIVPINRVKLHTDFVAEVQSGLCKMLVVGLGNHIGCSAVHESDFSTFGETILEAVQIILKNVKEGFGVAVIENAFGETALLESVPFSKIKTREKELLKISRDYMPTLMFHDIDVLIIEEIGKNISGAGYDPNIIGRSFLLKEFELPVPYINKMVLLDITDESHGNGAGIGNFDVITRKVFKKLDLMQIYANAIAVKSPDGAKIPIIADSEEEAIRIAIQMIRGVDKNKLKIVKIKNTSKLDLIYVSDAFLDHVKGSHRLELA